MEFRLKIGKVVFRICSDRSLQIDSEWERFVVEKSEETEILVRVSWEWDKIQIPEKHFLGQDAICNYYSNKDFFYCVTRGGPKGPVACTRYTSDCSEILCIINEKPFLESPKKISSIMRMIPIREILLSHRVLFLHSSQIVWKKKGILFTAPSGTGKTTQAQLWKKFRNAKIICNDRTLTAEVEDKWMTWGYPLDGSEPIISSEENKLGAVVILKQGDENKVTRLKVSQAIALLMQQVVFDCWNGKAREKVMDLLFSLLEDIPVFLLTCTADERAVDILEKKLIESEVIN